MMDGLLLVDKPGGITSHDVVHEVRKILNQRSVGHSGTLDPMATGLMVLLLGAGTKLSDYLLSQNKTYWLRLKLGISTDTLDKEGKILSEKPVSLSSDTIRQCLEDSVGEFNLSVPAFSAVKIKGKKLYEYARGEQAVELPTRQMHFYDLKVHRIDADSAELQISCSKGSYIRSWVAWMGEKLGTGAILDALRRLRSEPYDVTDAVTLERLKEMAGVRNFSGPFISMAEALPNLKTVVVHGKDERLLMSGQISNDLSARLVFEQRQSIEHLRTVPIKALSRGSGELVALLEAAPNTGLRVRRVFNLTEGRGYT